MKIKFKTQADRGENPRLSHQQSNLISPPPWADFGAWLTDKLFRDHFLTSFFPILDV